MQIFGPTVKKISICSMSHLTLAHRYQCLHDNWINT